MVLPVIAAASRGLIQGAGTLVKGTAHTLKGVTKGVSQGGKRPQRLEHAASSDSLRQPIQPSLQKKLNQPLQGRPGGRRISAQKAPTIAQQNFINRSASGGETKGGISGGSPSADSSAKGSLTSPGDKAKSGGISALFSSLLGALGMLDIFNGTWILFLLWTNYIGYNLLPIARPMLSKPGNEIVFLSSDFREITHTLGLFVLTGIYFLEVMLYIAVIILLLSLVAELLSVLPPPLNTLFQ